MVRANIKPKMLTWARERARMKPADLAGRFPKLPSWERGEAAPTLKQLESIAKATHARIAGNAGTPGDVLEHVDFTRKAGQSKIPDIKLLTEVERDRDAAAKQLQAYLKGLGYV